jgi:predicted DNA-binding transcriptional regulator YafY
MPVATLQEALSRQWLMLQWIPRYPRKITARELVEHLRAEDQVVTKRTVERDLAALSDVFPLASDERAKPFGWSWQKDAPQFSLPGMSPLQAMVLILAHTHLHSLLPAHLLEPLGPYFAQADDTLRHALGKRGLANWNQRVAVVQPTQPLLAPKINENAMAVVHAAVAQARQVDLRYRSRSAGKTRSYRVHSLGLIYRGIFGYLVCTIGDYDDPRLLALHRITSAHMLIEAAVEPEGFNLQAYAHSGAMGFMDNGSIKLMLRMEAPAAEHLCETPLSKDQAINADDRKGWVRITATVDDTSQLRWWLLGFGDQVEVVAPAHVRSALRDIYESAAHHYRTRSHAT